MTTLDKLRNLTDGRDVWLLLYGDTHADVIGTLSEYRPGYFSVTESNGKQRVFVPSEVTEITSNSIRLAY